MADNPTRTLTIEKNWRREISRRVSLLTTSITGELKRTNDLVVNKEVGLNASQIRAYMAFVDSEIERLILETAQAPNWQAEYQIQAYMRSMDRFNAELRAQGASEIASQVELATAQTLSPFTATPSLATATSLAPIHRDSLEFLFTRSYESLNGWTDNLSREVRQIVFDSVAQGQSMQKTAKAIRERTGVLQSRANLIAQTETNQAYGISQVNQAKLTQEITGEEIGLRWLTVRDAKVRHLHATWHGTIATPEESQARKGASPFNCRCGLAPVIPEANTEAKREKFAREREQLLELEKKDGAKSKPKAKAPPKPKRKAATKKAKPKKTPGRPKGFNNADQETQAFIDNAFDDPKYNKIVESVDSPRNVGKAREGAYYFDGGINMGKYAATTEAGKAVYRHEFGHHVDDSKGRPSATKEYENARAADEKILLGYAKDYYKDAKARHPSLAKRRYSVGAAKSAFNMDTGTVIKEYRESGQDLKTFAFANVEKGGIAEQLIKKLEESENFIRGERFVSALIAAERHSYPLGYIAAIWDNGGSSLLRSVWREAGQVADLVGAITNEKFGGGHGKHYYKVRRWNYHEGQTVEMFAQVFSLNHTGAGKLGAELSELFSPNGTEFLKGLL